MQLAFGTIWSNNDLLHEDLLICYTQKLTLLFEYKFSKLFVFVLKYFWLIIEMFLIVFFNIFVSR